MKHILLLDDSATSRMLFKAYMPEGHTFLLHEASDAASALKLAAEQRFDLVVFDYNMPGENGVAIANSLQRLGLAANFVLLTANAQHAVSEEATAAGLTRVFEKPITRELIAQLLQESLP